MAGYDNLFKALSDPTRLKIIRFLLNGERCVCEIHPHIKKTQSTASIHLKKLEQWKIIKQRRDGKYVFYRITDFRVCAVFKVLGQKRGCACQKTKQRC